MKRNAWLRVVEMQGAAPVPCTVYLSPGIRRRHGDALVDLVRDYPEIEVHPHPDQADDWGGLDARHTAGCTFTDAWGCVWENVHDGVVGQVARHPVESWDALKRFEPPDPAETGHFGPVDWERQARLLASARREGALARAAVGHGFFFQRLYYLRGFANLMEDIALGESRLDELCRLVLEFNRGLVRRYIRLGADVLDFGDDLGMQDRLTIHPDKWRRYVRPAYAELFGMCGEAGCHVYLHSDGHIVEIMPELIDCGVSILNPQDLCNGLESIETELKGRICIDLDIDRQKIVPRVEPRKVEQHVRDCVARLGSERGGLMLTCGLYEGTPLANVAAVLRGMRRSRDMFC